jgi:endonuclease/exonuclease/phosphatase family metal-dependent hydrolase
MSFNIRYLNDSDGLNQWNNRAQAVIDLIEESGADFIGLQEATKLQ